MLHPIRCLLIFAGIICFGSEIAFAPAQEKAKEWATLNEEKYQLNYLPEYEKDAKKVKGFLDAGIASLKKEFAEFPVDELLAVKCVIYLHPKGTGKASEQGASITSGMEKDKYFANIDLLTPSLYDPNYRTNVNEPPGDDQFSKLVIHEYSTILLERITRTKKTGWSYFNAPAWFVQGYEEYLALMHSSPRNRKEVLAKYLAMHKADPDRIDFEFGLSVKNDYIDGALLLLFMHETFGTKHVHAILTSEERRFGKALASSLGVGLDEFKKRWEEWIKKKVN